VYEANCLHIIPFLPAADNRQHTPPVADMTGKFA
jgi:hypothetical protein